MKAIIIKKENIENIYEKLTKSLKKLDIEYETHTFDEENIKINADFVIALGGDGTILKASKMALNSDTLILGINAGGLGFLSSIDGNDDFDKFINRIIKKEYYIDDRSIIQFSVERNDKNILEDIAINEIEMSSNRKSHVGKFSIYVDNTNNLLNEFSADGILISTPTGSSGYAFSTGAPIVYPSAKNIIITPIYPHAFNQRTFVLDDDKNIFTTIKSNNIDLLVDGTLKVELNKDDKVIVKKSAKNIRFISFDMNYYFNNLRERMKTL